MCVYRYCCVFAVGHMLKAEDDLQEVVLPVQHVSLGIELRLSDLRAGAFTHWGILPALS